jgi:hypothetical protein
MTEVEKVRVLLPHLIGHNRSHEEEFIKWAQVLRESGEAEAVVMLEQAIQSLRDAGRSLAKALEKIGGPLEEQKREHHHHG